mmetsp:Transcript_35965/g.83997  ORF Transcript_35965/g.83997 Transcript_35965/m.83997 type:complete len:86 (-) Transcript_35965:181-438(-)
MTAQSVAWEAPSRLAVVPTYAAVYSLRREHFQVEAAAALRGTVEELGSGQVRAAPRRRTCVQSSRKGGGDDAAPALSTARLTGIA